MGQYHKVYNTAKRECLDASTIHQGLKLLEQCGPGDYTTMADALWLLLANSNGRGGGDAPPHPLIGRWAGDPIVIQGDYAEESDPGYIPEAECETYTDITRDVDNMLTFVFGS